ncbi:hypothetical protein B5X24_HaOG210995 [Helicoverpa armigera]|nr:hypothetical protein B5X24_HaOG210995 [Helicoverpa armigera]
MRCEVPEFKRCCFCFPLRYGLLVWGIINLITTVYYNIFRVIKINSIVNHMNFEDDILQESIFLTLSIIDFLLNALFVFATITKKEKLLKYFLYGNSALGVLAVLYFLYIVGYVSYVFSGATVQLGWNTVKPYAWKAFLELTKSGLIIASQSFCLLLLWSEIKKLKRNSQPVMFLNHAGEAKCTMDDGDGEENCDDDDQEDTEKFVEIIEENSEIGPVK